MVGLHHVRAVALALAAALTVLACGGADPGVTPGSPTASPVTPASPAITAQPPETPAVTAASGEECEVVAEPGTVAVLIEGFSFSPGTAQASVGDVVEWTNRDAVPHTATLDAGCTTPNLGRDDTGAIRFTAPGTYPYICRIHPDMRGTIEVGG
jgi:plastocyanin